LGKSGIPLQVKWLLEPRNLHPENFTSAALEYFDVIYTHDPDILGDSRARAYPLGGTRIHESDWGGNVTGFDAPISIMASPKRGLPGHALRHDLIARCATRPWLTAYGPEYTPSSKHAMLATSLFHVAIEAVRSPLFFTEHLIDPMLMLNVPIYWGADRSVLESYGFDPSGIIFVPDIAELEEVIDDLSNERNRRDFYVRNRDAVRHNFHIAHAYTCTEDWLWRRDSSLFDD